MLILKALMDCSDKLVYTRVMGGDMGDSYLSDRLVATLREHSGLGKQLHAREHCLAFLGSRFRVVMKSPARLSDTQARAAWTHP